MKGSRARTGLVLLVVGIVGCVVGGIVNDQGGPGTAVGLVSFAVVMAGVVVLVAYRWQRVEPRAEGRQAQALERVCLGRHRAAVANELQPGETVQAALQCVHLVPWWQLVLLVCTGIGIVWAAMILQRPHYLVLTDRGLLIVQFPITSNPRPSRIWRVQKGARCELQLAWSRFWGWTLTVRGPQDVPTLRPQRVRARRGAPEPGGEEWERFRDAWRGLFGEGGPQPPASASG